MHGEMEKGLELGARGAEFRPSSTTSQLCDFGQVTASLSLSFVMYKIGLNNDFNNNSKQSLRTNHYLK